MSFLRWIQIFKISFQGSDGKFFFNKQLNGNCTTTRFIHERQDGSRKGNSPFRRKTLSYSAENKMPVGCQRSLV